MFTFLRYARPCISSLPTTLSITDLSSDVSLPALVNIALISPAALATDSLMLPIARNERRQTKATTSNNTDVKYVRK